MFYTLTVARDRFLPQDEFLDTQEPWIVTLRDEAEDGTSHTIGEMTVFEFRGARSADFFDQADAIDSEMARLAGALTDGGIGLPGAFFDWPIAFAADVLVISRLTIAPSHRGRGLGGQILTNALDTILGAHRPALIATYPAPFEALDDEAAWTRVRSFWEAQGFVHFAAGVAVAPYPGYAVHEFPPSQLRRYAKAWKKSVATPWAEPDAPVVISERMERLLI